MQHILLLGAGKSATILIDYLLHEAREHNWHIHIADVNAELIKSKTGDSSLATAHGINLEDEEKTDVLISVADLVISLLPPSLHIKIARKCLQQKKHFLNASYVSHEMQQLDAEAKEKGLLFLCEMGLDPGIDHMSAMEAIHGIIEEGGKIHSFKSHCGGLVAPESDDNPWHYKISWNPRNIVMAGKDGAVFKEAGEIKKVPYEKLFDATRIVDIPSIGKLSWYPNRDSLSYIEKYNLEEAHTFIRTTLRHPEFCLGWKNIVDLKLTEETPEYDTDGMTLSEFFQVHFERYGFSDWLEKSLSERFSKTRSLLDDLLKIMEKEKELSPEKLKEIQQFMVVNEEGKLQDISLGEMKSAVASNMVNEMHEANLSLKQLFYLGLDEDELIGKGRCSAADVLQFIAEKKLALKPQDKDMVVMLHEIGYELNDKKQEMKSYLVVKGEDNLRTAMAKTVGLPLGIAAKMILTGQFKNNKGVMIPVSPEIYKPVLSELEKNGIRFKEVFTL
jgi:saccharopine dehydrogenase-like NADP-dependent oxidoreductase